MSARKGPAAYALWRWWSSLRMLAQLAWLYLVGCLITWPLLILTDVSAWIAFGVCFVVGCIVQVWERRCRRWEREVEEARCPSSTRS